jgi:hypothetical protein
MNQPITLETPIKRANGDITAIALRKPNAGQLRGCSLASLLQMDVDAIIKVLPRISEPGITEAEAAKLDPVDLTTLAAETVGFLLPKQAQPEASPTE